MQYCCSYFILVRFWRSLHSGSHFHRQSQPRSRIGHPGPNQPPPAIQPSLSSPHALSASQHVSLFPQGIHHPLSRFQRHLLWSPGLRGMGSPTSTNTDGNGVGDAGYSPALETVENFGGQEDTVGEVMEWVRQRSKTAAEASKKRGKGGGWNGFWLVAPLPVWVEYLGARVPLVLDGHWEG
jgi:hypothetical protein